jgi:beta-mannosidase
VPEALRRYWRPIEELSPAEYVVFGQLLQAEGLKFAIEHWRRRKFNTSGTLFWNYADCWGATVGWTVVDYYLRKKAAYDAVRRAYAPLLASIEHAGDRLRFWLVNDTLQAVDGMLEYGLCELPTSRVQAFAQPATAPANAAACIAELDVAGIPPEETGRWAAYARFMVDGEVVSRNRLFLAGFHFNRLTLPRAVFSQQVSDDALVLRADTFVWQIHVETPPGVRIEDDHFDLFPGEERRLRLSGPAEMCIRVRAAALNDSSLPQRDASLDSGRREL